MLHFSILDEPDTFKDPSENRDYNQEMLHFSILDEPDTFKDPSENRDYNQEMLHKNSAREPLRLRNGGIAVSLTQDIKTTTIIDVPSGGSGLVVGPTVL